MKDKTQYFIIHYVDGKEVVQSKYLTMQGLMELITAAKETDQKIAIFECECILDWS